MITITEVQKILLKHNYKLTRTSIANWIKINRVNGIECIDNSIMYSINDLLPYIQKRIGISLEQLQEDLKDIRTKLIK